MYVTTVYLVSYCHITVYVPAASSPSTSHLSASQLFLSPFDCIIHRTEKLILYFLHYAKHSGTLACKQLQYKLL